MKNRQKNIFLLGSREEYVLMKKWANKEKKFHLNGWFHDKNIPTSTHDLLNEYSQLVGENVVDHFVLDPSDMEPEILKASIKRVSFLEQQEQKSAKRITELREELTAIESDEIDGIDQKLENIDDIKTLMNKVQN